MLERVHPESRHVIARAPWLRVIAAALASVGEWLSLVEHLVRDQGVGGSNPLSPTNLYLVLTTTYAPVVALIAGLVFGTFRDTWYNLKLYGLVAAANPPATKFVDRRMSPAVCSLIPTLRMSSATGTPTSACFSTPTICSTENRFFFTHNLLSDCAED
jgi:hypothetical protein